MTLDLELVSPAATSATAAPSVTPRTDRVYRGVVDYAAVVGAWAVVVVAASLFPFEGEQVSRAALFIHLMSMAIGFGAVVMVDIYGVLWLFGQRTLGDVMSLATAAHTVIALAVGGLLASGIALRPDLDSLQGRFKMVLVLVLMLNGVAAQRLLERFTRGLSAHTRGASIPWAGFQRVLAAAMISQSTWWGAIAIGFITNTNRHSGG